MAISDRLRPIVQSLPDEAMVTLSVHTLRNWLADEAEAEVAPASGLHPDADLTLTEVAQRMQRSESTVRGWLNRGLVPGAYKLRGRAWRVPHAALASLRRSPDEDEPRTRGAHHEKTLRWR